MHFLTCVYVLYVVMTDMKSVECLVSSSMYYPPLNIAVNIFEFLIFGVYIMSVLSSHCHCSLLIPVRWRLSIFSIVLLLISRSAPTCHSTLLSFPWKILFKHFFLSSQNNDWFSWELESWKKRSTILNHSTFHFWSEPPKYWKFNSVF